jgi:hypothetical protein
MSDHATAAEQSPRSIAILGADALLVALPSTPTQLVNACFADGYDEVFPATWGDELVAAGCLEQLESRTGPAIFCACPLVSEQLRGAADLRRFIIPLISPPVAVARYLRASRPGQVLRITYVGDCPGAYDDSIDVRLSPHELLSALSKRGIITAMQRPDIGDDVAHDRRRFYSLPGGVPAPQWLAAQWPKRELADVHAGDALAGLANQTLSRGNTLIDFAPHLGCACAGAIGGADAEKARKAVTALEPPRASSEIVDASVHIEVSLAPAGEHHDADVAWGDFLAALPAALAMHPEHGHAPVARQTSRTAPRRALQKKAALPRAYMAARAGARRERGAAAAPPIAPSRELESRASQTSAIAPSSDAYGARREEISATRPNPWLARRASQEGMTGPRGASPLRAGLGTADRWLLAGLMLASSVLVAVLTSALTVRGMQQPASAAVPEIASHTQAETPVVMAPVPSAGDSVAVARASQTNDSASIAIAAHTDSARDREEASGAVAPPPPTTTRLSPMPSQVARVPKRVVPRVERRPLALAARAHTAPSVSAVPTSSIATRPSAATPPATSAPSIAPPSIAPPSPAASSPTVPTAAPAAAASPLANPAVLEELRAIHAEINARKRHMDSLTAALDSLNHATKPN